jgi:hypothetical protein
MIHTWPDDELAKYKLLAMRIMAEVEHKHGGPESSQCVSPAYIYGLLCSAMDLEQQPKCSKCRIDQ